MNSATSKTVILNMYSDRLTKAYVCSSQITQRKKWKFYFPMKVDSSEFMTW